MGLGPYPDVSLAEAREAAHRYRAAVRPYQDPIEDRRKIKAVARAALQTMTFRQVADRYIAAHEAGWRNEKHRYQWRQTLGLACEQIGQTSVAAIDTGDVMRVLEAIWLTRTETALRLRGRIESVLDYAKARGWRTGDNPARWRGHLAQLLPPPRRIAKVVHLAALPWPQIGAFMAQLRAQDSIVARALEFTVLTGARSGEVLGARWSEIDLQATVWVVPGGRMKRGREHRVPLSDPVLEVLRLMLPMRDGQSGDRVFPGVPRHRPLSPMSMIELLRRMKYPDVTVHGMRSAFRDWCAEATNYPREVAEMALAHTLRDKTEAAYQRRDMIEKRRRLMEDWAAHCGRIPPADGEVVPLRRIGAAL
jgi:integrase